VASTNNKWNGAAWSGGSAWTMVVRRGGCFVLNNLMSIVTGLNSSDSGTNDHNIRNTSDTVSTATVAPANSASGGQSSASGVGYMPFSNPSTGGYSWNGSAWSSVITAPYQGGSSSSSAQAYLSSKMVAINNGGATNDSGAGITSTLSFNGVGVSAAASSSTGRATATASAI